MGTLSALPTAVAGLNDWRDTSGAERRVGLLHAGMNSVALLLYAASWVARRRGEHAVGVALTVPAMMAVGGGGWLGGHLSYAMGVGVDTTAFQGGNHEWVDALGVDQVAVGRLSVAEVDGVAVLVTRTEDSAVVAYADRCTHRGGALHEGDLLDGCIRCPLHGSTFSLADGSVIHGPATRPQPASEVRTIGNRIQVRRTGKRRPLRNSPVGS